MSRISNVDVIEVKPTVNVYTALVAAALIAELIAFIALYVKSTDIFESAKGLFS